MATYPVKYFDSATMTGLPPCRGTDGDLIAMLDAMLITGFNVRTPTTGGVVVESNVCTITFPSAHGYIVGQIVRVSGATGAGADQINGDHYVTFADTASIKFADISGVPDGQVSGTVEVRAAPLDWEKPFSGTNKAVYRSADPQSTRMFYRVKDDEGDGRIARVTMYESMTDVDTGTGASTVFGDHYFVRAPSAGSTPYRYLCAGDARLFYLAVSWYPYDGEYFPNLHVAGDIISFKAGDAFNAVLCAAGHPAPVPSWSSNGEWVLMNGNARNTCIARDSSQIGGAVGLARWGSRRLDVSGFNGFPYPNAADGGLLLHHVLLDDGGSVRGIAPGCYQILQGGTLPAHGTIITDIDGLPGRRIMMMYGENEHNSKSPVAIDITGPWR